MTSPELTATSTTSRAAPERWICWPTPDRVCIEGGCIYCLPDPDAQSPRYIRAHYRSLTRDQVIAYADTNGLVVSETMVNHGMIAYSTDTERSRVITG